LKNGMTDVSRDLRLKVAERYIKRHPRRAIPHLSWCAIGEPGTGDATVRCGLQGITPPSSLFP
jgi:hypothetical protein